MNTGATTLTRHDRYYTKPLHLSRARQDQPLYKPPVASQVSFALGGKRNVALTSPTNKVWLSAKTLVPVGQNTSKPLTERVVTIAKKAHEMVEAGTETAVKNIKFAKNFSPVNKIPDETFTTAPDETFTTAIDALESINVAAKGISFIKSTKEAVYGAVKDAAAHGKRKEASSLLKAYNPETRTFDLTTRSRQRKKLKSLMAEEGSDLSRSTTQVSVSRLAQLFNLAKSGASIVNKVMRLVRRIIPVLGNTLSVISGVTSGIKTGIQISALNNLSLAKAGTKDPLLHALAGHIKQERTFKARTALISTLIDATTLAGVIAGGAPLLILASGAIVSSVSLSDKIFSTWHEHKLNKNRELTDAFMEYRLSTSALAVNNIGVAEKAFLLRLRHAHGETLKESVDFLRRFGLTDATIKKLQLAPRKAAMKKLREVLYQDKVKYQGLQLKETGKTLSHVVGLSALGRRISNGSLWLNAKLMPDRNKSITGSGGGSLKSKPPKGQHKHKTVVFVNPERVRPALSLNQRVNA